MVVVSVSKRASLAVGAVAIGLVLVGCGSGNGPIAAFTSSSTASAVTTATPSSITSKPAHGGVKSNQPTAASSAGQLAGGAARCPTLAQANAALAASYSGPITTATAGGGIVCRYTGAGGIAVVAIFAHQSATVFAGQVSNAPGAPAMAAISGVGNGAFGQTVAGRSIVNAYSNASRTVVAAQAPGALAPVEALARVALADN
jgi:hypothetical protein